MKAKLALLFAVCLLAGLATGYAVSPRQPAGEEKKAESAFFEPESSEADAHVSYKRIRRLLKAALASLPGEPKTVERGTITGEVRTEDGKSLSGVEVRAVPSAAVKPAETDTSGLEKRLCSLLAVHRRKQKMARSTQTRNDGSFALEGLAEGEYSLTAVRKGYAILPQKGHNADNVYPGAKVCFVARAIFEIPVTVLLPDGSKPKEAWVEWETPEWSWARRRAAPSGVRWLATDPAIRLEPGLYRLAASCTGIRAYRSDTKTVSIMAGKPIAPLVFHLKALGGLRGKALFPPGEEPDRTYVRMIRVEGEEVPSLDALDEMGFVCSATADAKYAFAFHDLEPGPYAIAATLANGRLAGLEVIHVTEETKEMDLVLPPLDPSEYVILRVLGPDGAPLKEVQVDETCVLKGGAHVGGSPYRPVPRADGSYRIFHPAKAEEIREGPEGIPEYILEIISKAYGTRKIPCRPGKDIELVVSFASSATLELTLQGFDEGQHHGMLLVGIEMAADRRKRDEPGGAYMSDPEGLKAVGPGGSATLGPLEPGEHVLVVAIKERGTLMRRSTLEVVTRKVTLHDGANTLAVALPQLFTLSVRLPYAGSEADLHLQPLLPGADFVEFRKSPDENGLVVFRCLPAGKYSLSLAEGESSGKMIVTLPGQEHVVFEPKPRTPPGLQNALEVTITDMGGFLASLGLQNGDLIIGIDSTLFKNWMHMQALLASALTKESSKWMIQRGSRTFEIAVSTHEMTNAEDPGGGLMPVKR